MPRLNSNDDTYVLVDWVIAPGEAVEVDDVVASVETSKAVTDLVATHAGYLSHELPVRAVCRPGDVVARVWDTVEEARAQPVPASQTGPVPEPATSPAVPDAPVVTRAARELMTRHGIDDATVAALGRRVVKRDDIEALIAPTTVGTVAAAAAPTGAAPKTTASDGAAATGTGTPLPVRQRAVARAVARSHATVPAAFTVIEVSAEGIRRRQKVLGQRTRAVIGVAEQVVAAVAALRPRFPIFFATVHDDLTVTMADRSDVGVTIDVGRGLSVPVVREADQLDLPAIADRLMRLRLRAVRGVLREEDLAAPTIAVSLHTEPGIVLAQPIVLPGLTCTLSVAGIQWGLRLGLDGRPVPHGHLYIGAAYDHRAINGSDTVAFLAALREALEQSSAVEVAADDEQMKEFGRHA
jgi:2-oxoglutarate dehydrogenase E2 component (dihydrolipoamide succinyltransferase)